MSLLRIENANIEDRRVLLRTDFGPAFEGNGAIQSDAFIKLHIPTIELLLQRRAGVLIASHAGQPGGEKHSMEAAAESLSKHLKHPVKVIKEAPGGLAGKATLPAPGEIAILENLQQYKGEAKNETEFARKLAALADLYVNDAFAASQEEYASTSTLPGLMEAYAGMQLYRSMEECENLLSRNYKPLLMILGGVGLDKKLKFIQKMIKQADSFALGGGLAYTFIKSRAVPVGNSLVNPALQVDAFQVIEKAELESTELLLPEDHVVAERFSKDAKSKTAGKMDIPDSWQALDIGSKTLGQLEKLIKKAGIIYWHGPMGVVEMDKYTKGTLGTARALAKAKGRTIVTGESTIKFLNQAGLDGKMDHIAAGSAGMLQLLMGGSLPGIDALRKS